MSKTKKVIALVLAFMMIFSSVSVLASATFDPETDDGSTLTVSAQFYKTNDGGTTWEECTKVSAGDSVQVRVKVGTDFYSNAATLMFFYDNNFFTDSYSTGMQALAVNDSDFSDSVFTKQATGYINRLINSGAITSEFAAAHNYFVVQLYGDFDNYMYDGSDWLFSFDLEVLASPADSDGAFFIVDETLKTTTNQDGVIDFPKGPQGGDEFDSYSMSQWYTAATWAGCTTSVTTDSSITLDPAGGIWGDTSTSLVREFNGTTGDSFARPALSSDGKTLIGWYDSSISNATADDCTYGPAGPTEYSADEDIELTAFWIDQVGATFSYNYDGAPAPVNHAEATPGYPVGWTLDADNEKDEYIVPDDPDRDGYEFRGWSTDAAASPQSADLISDFDGMVYGDSAVTYYMIWAKSVTVTFYDTEADDDLGTATGYAGDPFDGTVPTAPTYPGLINIAGEGNFYPAAPSVYPANDTTYNAIYEPEVYKVNYIIYSAKGSGTAVYTTNYDVAYGEEIPVNVSYTAPQYKNLEVWFTDSACDTAFTDGTTCPIGGTTLYGYLDDETYTIAYYADANDANPVFSDEIPFGAVIPMPASDPVKDGYIFAGWTPNVTAGEILDDHNDRTYVATWELDQDIKEFFYMEDGVTNYVTLDNDEGAPFEIPADPYKYGHEFSGWDYYKLDDTAISEPGVMPDYSVKAVANFTPADFDVTFNANGGNFGQQGGEDIVDVTEPSTFGQAINIPADEPVRTGYTFLGWAASDSATQPDASLGTLTVETDPDNPLTFYAVWEANEYTLTITYETTDDKDAEVFASITNPYEEDVTYGDTYTVASPDIPGYELVDSTQATITGTMNSVNGVQVTVTYQPLPYTLTINYEFADGGEAAPTYTDNAVYFNTDYSVGSPAVTGYTPDIDPVTGTMDTVGGKTVTVTYTANSYTATFLNDNGSEFASDDFAFDSAITAPAGTPVKTGYTFQGWSRTQGATTPDASLGNMDSVDGVTFYPVFSINSYTLTVVTKYSDGHEADVTTTSTVVYDTAYDATPPEVTGYSWTADNAVAGNMPANDLTVTITYTPHAAGLTIQYKYADGTQAAADYTDNNLAVNAPYGPIASPTIIGYTPDKETVSGTMTSETVVEVVTYYPNKHDITVTTTYSDGSQPDSTVTDSQVPFGTAYDKTPAEVTGYTWAATGDAYTGTMPDQDVVITVTYTPIDYTLTVITKYSDGSVADATSTETKHINDAYDVTPAEVTGYTWAADKDVSGTMGAGDLTITITYTPIDYTLTVITKYSDGSVADATSTETKHINDAYDVTPAEVTGYSWASDVSVTGTMGAGDLTITITYTPINYNIKVITTYTDGANEPLETNQTVAYGAHYDKTPAEVTGYSWTATGDDLTGTMPARDIEINITYTPIKYALTITYATTDGHDEVFDNITNPYEDDVDFGANYTVASPVITGYQLVDATQATITGTMDENGATYTVQYAPKDCPVTVHYEYADGTKAADDYTGTVKYNASYSVPSPAITGYTPSRPVVAGRMTDENGVEVTVVYNAKQAGLTINYIYQGSYEFADGTQAAPSHTDSTLHFNDPYGPITSPVITGYEPDQATVSGFIDDADGVVVTVTYTPVNYNIKVTTTYTDGSNEPLETNQTVAYGAPYDKTPADVDGYSWTATGDAISGTMPARDIEINITYSRDSVNVSFAVPVRIATENDPNYGKLDYANATVTSGTYDIGASLNVPDATATEIDNYIFKGWTTTPVTGYSVGGETADATPANAEAEVTYYAVYEREAVYLISRDATKSSIDRRGNDPTVQGQRWVDNFTVANFTLDNYKSATSYGLWFVHVTPNFRVTARSNPYLTTFFDTHGDGEITVTQGAGGYGTGSLVTVTDKVTGQVVEEFYVVIYGDIDGNTQINATDRSILLDAYQHEVYDWAVKGTYDHCKVMAANLNTPNRININSADYSALVDVVSGVATLNPLTGALTY